MASSSVQVLDNLVLFDDKVTHKTKLFLGESESQSEKTGIIRSTFAKVASLVGPMAFIQAAASKTSRYKNFFLFSVLSFILFVMALTSLPLILIFPEKFALFFSLASLVMHVALSYLKESTEEYIQALVSNKDHSTVLALYFVSLFFTIYSTVYLGSYVVILASSGVQFFAIGWYLFTMFPRGSQGVLTVFKYSLKLCPCGKSLLPI